MMNILPTAFIVCYEVSIDYKLIIIMIAYLFNFSTYGIAITDYSEFVRVLNHKKVSSQSLPQPLIWFAVV